MGPQPEGLRRLRGAGRVAAFFPAADAVALEAAAMLREGIGSNDRLDPPSQEVLQLIDAFRASFADIAFELRWESDVGNFHPSVESRCIELHGGLIRSVPLEAVAVMIAHEVAHYTAIAEGRQENGLACERLADYHAVRDVMPMAFGNARDMSRVGIAALRDTWLGLADMQADEPPGCDRYPSRACRLATMTAANEGERIPDCD